MQNRTYPGLSRHITKTTKDDISNVTNKRLLRFLIAIFTTTIPTHLMPLFIPRVSELFQMRWFIRAGMIFTGWWWWVLWEAPRVWCNKARQCFEPNKICIIGVQPHQNQFSHIHPSYLFRWWVRFAFNYLLLELAWDSTSLRIFIAFLFSK